MAHCMAQSVDGMGCTRGAHDSWTEGTGLSSVAWRGIEVRLRLPSPSSMCSGLPGIALHCVSTDLACTRGAHDSWTEGISCHDIVAQEDMAQSVDGWGRGGPAFIRMQLFSQIRSNKNEI